MPHCLLCTGALGRDVFPYRTRFNGQTYGYRACTRCGTSTIDPLPDPEQIAAMYRQDDYHDLFYAEQEEGVATMLDDYVSTSRDKSLRLLDFGCGGGQFLRHAKALSFAAQGVELDPTVREHAAQQSGCPVHSLAEVKASGARFDIIHLGDVLEHLPTPEATMRALEQLLAQGGRFFIEGPLETNASLVRSAGVLFGEVRKRLGRPALGSFPPYHLFQTNARAQRAFFEERLGYAVERFDVWETGWPYKTAHPRGSASARLRDLIGRAAVVTAAAARPVARLGNRFAALVSPGSP